MRAFGFTLLELLIVLGILAVVAVASAPFLASSISRNDLQTSTWKLVDDLRRAQTQAMAGHTNSAWGVHVQTDRHVFFRGTTYNISDPDNIVTMLPGTITISNISLNGGSSDIRFTKIRGNTNDYGTLTLLDSNSNETTTITINSAGHIQ